MELEGGGGGGVAGMQSTSLEEYSGSYCEDGLLSHGQLDVFHTPTHSCSFLHEWINTPWVHACTHMASTFI